MRIIRFSIDGKRRFHMGDSYGDIKSIFSSDQLFSAIINATDLLYGKESAEELIEQFQTDVISVSSLFPGLKMSQGGKNQFLYLFPLPNASIRNPVDSDDEITNRKKKKNLRFVSLSVLKNLMRHWDEDEKCFKYNLLNNMVFINNKIGIDSSDIHGFDVAEKHLENLDFISADSTPHNVISRQSGASEDIFYVDSLILEKKGANHVVFEPFMYFLLEGRLEKEMLASIRLIADEGIGGKRSIGMGFFDGVEFIDGEVFNNEGGRYFLSLSSILPCQDETERLISYGLKNVSGYIHSGHGTTIRKKEWRMLSEGCISRGKLKGTIANATPEIFKAHRIYLYGKGIQIGFGDAR